MKTFAERLKALRKENNYTQAEISKILNMSRSTYSGWESEGKEPDIHMICVLANLFGVTCDYLLGYSDDRTHADTVFTDDHDEFRKHYENLPPDMRGTVARTFDSFYLLLNHDMQLCRPEQLELYQKLLYETQRFRSMVRNRIESANQGIGDLKAMSDMMALQNEFKNTVSAILDELAQADMETAFRIKNGLDGALPGKVAV